MRALLVTAVLAGAAILAAPISGESVGQNLQQPPQKSTIDGRLWFKWLVVVCSVLYLGTAVSSIRKNAKRRMYDVELAVKYTDVFFKDRKDEVTAGTKELISYHSENKKWGDRENRYDVEPILDVLDDIGFLLHGRQISERVCYQYFSYWIQLYYEASKEYVALRQEEDRSLYEHIPDLYERMMVIMAHKCGNNATQNIYKPDKLLEALNAELDH